MQIPLKSIGLVVALFFVLQLTATQPPVAHISAIDGPLKVRPAGLPNPIPIVVSRAEAEIRLIREQAQLERFEASQELIIEWIKVRESVSEPCDNSCSKYLRAKIERTIMEAALDWRAKKGHCPTVDDGQPCY